MDHILDKQIELHLFDEKIQAALSAEDFDDDFEIVMQYDEKINYVRTRVHLALRRTHPSF